MTHPTDKELDGLLAGSNEAVARALRIVVTRLRVVEGAKQPIGTWNDGGTWRCSCGNLLASQDHCVTCGALRPVLELRRPAPVVQPVVEPDLVLMRRNVLSTGHDCNGIEVGGWDPANALALLDRLDTAERTIRSGECAQEVNRLTGQLSSVTEQLTIVTGKLAIATENLAGLVADPDQVARYRERIAALLVHWERGE